MPRQPLRTSVLATFIALAFGLLDASAHAMTFDQAMHLAAAASLNDTAALAKIRAAAQNGDVNAQDGLGYMYLVGWGVRQDDVIAYALYNISATNTSPQHNYTAADREKLGAQMTRRQLAEGQSLTRRMLSRGF